MAHFVIRNVSLVNAVRRLDQVIIVANALGRDARAIVTQVVILADVGSPMDSTIRQTSTVTPAKPGDFLFLVKQAQPASASIN
ncbi:MAG: hypothetical protein ACYDDP_07480 [Acidithiobacillus sp.]